MGSQCCTLQSCHQHACSSSLMLPGGSALDMMKRQKLCMHWFIFRTGAIIVTASVKVLFARLINSDLRVCFLVFATFRSVYALVGHRIYVCMCVHWGQGGYWFEYDRMIKVLRNWRFWPLGGAEHQFTVSVDVKAVGGFALTLPILWINVFMSPYRLSHWFFFFFSPRERATRAAVSHTILLRRFFSSSSFFFFLAVSLRVADASAGRTPASKCLDEEPATR